MLRVLALLRWCAGYLPPSGGRWVSHVNRPIRHSCVRQLVEEFVMGTQSSEEYVDFLTKILDKVLCVSISGQ